MKSEEIYDGLDEMVEDALITADQRDALRKCSPPQKMLRIQALRNRNDAIDKKRTAAHLRREATLYDAAEQVCLEEAAAFDTAAEKLTA